MVTIKDVAADAGVSVGTVSKVLNNMYVKADNRRRVEESIHLSLIHIWIEKAAFESG